MPILTWLIAAQQGPGDVYLVMAPLFPPAGSVAVLATVWIGGCQVFAPAFEAAAALNAIAAERVTCITLGVPTMLAALAEQLVRPRQVKSAVAQPWWLAHCYGGVRRAHSAFQAAEMIHVYGAT